MAAHTTFGAYVAPIDTRFVGGHATEWTSMVPPRGAKSATFINRGTGAGYVSIGWDYASTFNATDHKVTLATGDSRTVLLTDDFGSRPNGTTPLVSVFGADGATHAWEITWEASR